MNNQNFQTIFLNSCQSTMDEAKKLNSNKNDISCIVSRIQTAGRGRNGNTWTQAQNQNSDDIETKKFSKLWELYNDDDFVDFYPLTLIVPMHLVKVPLEWISILVGCALFDTINETQSFIQNLLLQTKIKFQPKKYAIKWPNDIVTLSAKNSDSELNSIEYKKICGILCETSLINGKVNEIYIGVGFNFFNHPQLPNSASFIEESFAQKLSPQFKKNILEYFTKLFCTEFQEYLLFYRQTEQLKQISLSRMLPVGTTLSVNKGQQTGTFKDIGLDGSLILDGIKEPIFSGDISIEKELFHNTLALDFGNTRIHIAFQNKNRKIQYFDIQYKDYIFELNKIINNIVQEIKTLKCKKLVILYSTVNTLEKTNQILNSIKNILNSKNILSENFVTKIFQLTEKNIFDCIPFKENFQPNKIGTDRALKYYYAYEMANKNKKNSLVLTFGTAITCEGVSKNGEFLENFVLPGLQMSLTALNNFTALLPLLQVNSNLFQPKNNTWDQEIYLQRGIFLSACGIILAAIKMHEPCDCYFSGGNKYQVEEIVKFLNEKNNFDIKYDLITNLETNVIFNLNDNVNFQKNINSFATPINTTPFLPEILANQKLLPGSITFLNSAVEPRNDKDKSRNDKDKSRNDKDEPRLEKLEIEDDQEYEIKDEINYRKIGLRIENSNNDRLDTYMALKYKFNTRKDWQNRILNHDVLIEFNSPKEPSQNHKPILTKIKSTYKIKNFDQIWLYQKPQLEIIENHDIETIYDDNDVCIFSKPPNLVVHAVGLYVKNTFVENIQNNGYKNCFPIHRIDKETSGILVCARNPDTRRILSNSFRNTNVKKMYLAITKGNKDCPDQFIIDKPIGEPENSLIRLKLWVHGQNSQPAKTYFTKLASHEDYSLFACQPITGRTNQIRIHLASIDQWIVGDKMYHPNENVFIEFFEKGYTQWVSDQVLFPRHILHNFGILFNEPDNYPLLSFEPQICPLTQDVLNFEIAQKLMLKANMPIPIKEQKILLRELFLKVQKNDFTNAIIFE